jgi:four helix bundle protein
MPYKFEPLEVWKLSLDYMDLIYRPAENLPRSEDYNLKSQITRAATSVALNIAEVSQGQGDAEQARFLGMAIRSLIETVACQQIIRRRAHIQDNSLLQKIYDDSQLLSRKPQSF